MSIGALAGVRQSEAGVASGLLNTSQQVGGAIGVAVANTLAATFAGRYADAHPGLSAVAGRALTHGFDITFYVLAGVAGAGAVLAWVMLEPRPAAAEEAAVGGEMELENAA
jgi:hypothetical protein